MSTSSAAVRAATSWTGDGLVIQSDQTQQPRVLAAFNVHDLFAEALLLRTTAAIVRRTAAFARSTAAGFDRSTAARLAGSTAAGFGRSTTGLSGGSTAAWFRGSTAAGFAGSTAAWFSRSTAGLSGSTTAWFTRCCTARSTTVALVSVRAPADRLHVEVIGSTGAGSHQDTKCESGNEFHQATFPGSVESERGEFGDAPVLSVSTTVTRLCFGSSCGWIGELDIFCRSSFRKSCRRHDPKSFCSTAAAAKDVTGNTRSDDDDRIKRCGSDQAVRSRRSRIQQTSR